MIGGSIAYFGLRDWWLSTFTATERRHIQETYAPLGSSGDTLTTGTLDFTTETAVGLLSGLSGWFTKAEDRSIAHRILAKAEELSEAEPSILAIHFHHHSAIEAYYRARAEVEMLDKAIEACRKQISVAPRAAEAFMAEWGMIPGHKGYQQLAVILERQQKFAEVITLCEQAGAEGWGGDWKGRIERCKKRLTRAQFTPTGRSHRPSTRRKKAI
jgi:hypothetical protein